MRTAATSFILLIGLVSTVFLRQPTQTQASVYGEMAIATSSPVVTPPTFNKNNGTSYTLGSRLVQITVPKGWQLMQSNLDVEYIFAFKISGKQEMYLFVSVRNAWEIYLRLMNSRCTCIVSARDLLESLSFELQSRSSYTLKTMQPAELGPLSGYQLEGDGLVFDILGPFEYRAASLPDGSTIMISISSTKDHWKEAQKVFFDVLNSITVTKTFPTLHPLLITATALQQQIDALTLTPAPSLNPN